MTGRTETQLEIFLSEINRDWKLSVIEEKALSSILNLFLAGDLHTVSQVWHCATGDTENLLKEIGSSDVTRFAERHLGMVHEDYCDDCEECGELSDYDDKEIIAEFYGRELERFGVNDIITESNLAELTDNFLSADFYHREYILSCSRESDLNTRLANFSQKHLK